MVQQFAVLGRFRPDHRASAAVTSELASRSLDLRNRRRLPLETSRFKAHYTSMVSFSESTRLLLPAGGLALLTIFIVLTIIALLVGRWLIRHFRDRR